MRYDRTARALGIQVAAPEREVYVMVGDGSYLMMAQEIVTSLQEGCKLNIVLLDNHGFGGIGGLSQAWGGGGVGTRCPYRKHGDLSGDVLPVDFAANAASLGAPAASVRGQDELRAAVDAMKEHDRATIIVVETDPEARVPCSDLCWDVPITETSSIEIVRAARKEYGVAKQKERSCL